LKKQILLNTGSAVITKVGKLAVGLLTVPLFLNTLGKEGYGFIVLITVFVSFSTLLEFGIRAGLVRYYTKSLVNKSSSEFNKYFTSAFLLYLILWLFVALLILNFAEFIILEIFNISNTYKGEVKNVVLFYILPITFLNFLSPILGAVLSSYHRFDIVNYRDLIITIITFPSLYVSLSYFKLGIFGWAAVSLSLQIFHLIILFIVVKRLVPSITFDFKGLKYSYFKKIISFGSYTFIGNISRRLKIEVDPFLISAFSNPAAVSLYRSGVSMPGHTRPIISSFSSQIYTFATAVNERGETVRLKSLLEKGTKYTLLLAIFMLCIFIFLSDSIAYIWLYPSLNKADLKVVSIYMKGMAIIDFCFYLEGTSYSILYGINRLKNITIIDLTLGIVNIILSIYLLNNCDGLTPVVLIPTIIIESIARPIFLYYTAEQIGYKKTKIWNQIYKPTGLCLIFCLVSMFIFSKVYTIYNYNNFLIIIIGTTLLTLSWTTSSYYLALNNSERKEVIDFIGNIFSYFKNRYNLGINKQ
jgi:O-antigen/teichoic acid export membrane protein